MKRIACIMLCGLMLLSMAACDSGSGSGTDTTTPTPQPTPTPPTTTPSAVTDTTPADTTTGTESHPSAARDTAKEYRVLLIGNSFTYYNDMNKPNGIFYKIATNAGYKVTVDSVYKGGYYLHQYLDETDAYGKQVAAYLKKNKYDVVVLQDQSAVAITNPGDLYDSCRAFKTLIEANGAEMWLYETWGYKTGHASLKSFGRDTFEMEMKIRAAYAAIGKELNVPVAYAGAAFSRSFSEHPDIELYHTDLKHPGVMGSYLIAWTLFGTIFGVDPATLDYNGLLPSSYAEPLRAVASEIIRNGAPVDAAYATSSEGVHAPKLETYVDASKTKMLSSVPSSDIISVIYGDASKSGDGWIPLKGDSSRKFSGIRGDRDQIASPECSATQLTDAQKADIADRGYGVSIIGISHMDATKKGAVNTKTTAGNTTHAIPNLVNGHWGSSYMAAMYFDKDTYNINGAKDSNAHYTGLITLNFGERVTFDAIGYLSGSLKGFAQAQDVYVSDNGEDWVKVESACYDASLKSLSSVDVSGTLDPWNKNKATVGVLFSMAGYSGKYIRIGIYRGGIIDGNTTGLEQINTREIVVMGKR